MNGGLELFILFIVLFCYPCSNLGRFSGSIAELYVRKFGNHLGILNILIDDEKFIGVLMEFRLHEKALDTSY